MNFSMSQLQRFIYSHHFYSGVRRASGILLPVLVMGGVLGQYATGLVATFGALCVAFIDQPGPHEHRGREMLGGALLGAITVTVTGLAASHPFWIWLAVIGQCFGFSMLSVYGKKGGQIGFACLLLMTVTLHAPLSYDEVWLHTLTSFAGGLFYSLYSYTFSRLMMMREKEQALSVALFSTADYIARRGDMYDLDIDLEQGYQKLIACQSDMTEKHQAARDMVLRGLSHPPSQYDPRHIMLWNLFVEMIAILDTLVATRTDYVLLRRSLEKSDALLFMRDALYKMSLEIERIALAVSREKIVVPRSSVKAELRALEYEIELMQKNGLNNSEPDVYRLCLEILRRLRNNAHIIDRMVESTSASTSATPLQVVDLSKSLGHFLSRHSFRMGMLTSNLRLDSPFCRYALRVALAGGIAMMLSTLIPTLARQGYWILLTVVIIMKPGFALTRQRNAWRLFGTLMGCAIAFTLLYSAPHASILFVLMVLCTILGGSMLQVNFMAASTFNTVAVLLAFHFIDPAAATVITDRALDTLIGSLVCFACGYFLPWWEAQYMPSLAKAAISANRTYLQAGLHYLATLQTYGHQALAPEVRHADLLWRLGRKNVHIAFSNFAEAFYRMMLEPKSRQKHVPAFNNLLIQNHMLASQITAVMNILLTMPTPPADILTYLDDLAAVLIVKQQLAINSTPVEISLPALPASMTSHAYPDLLYPLKQLRRSVQSLYEEIQVIKTERTASESSANHHAVAV
jgi:uncharacterized membrane protein YccC